MSTGINPFRRSPASSLKKAASKRCQGPSGYCRRSTVPMPIVSPFWLATRNSFGRSDQAMRLIRESVGATRVDTVVRQREAWAREVPSTFARGDARRALYAFASRGPIHGHDGPRAAVEALTGRWQQLIDETSFREGCPRKSRQPHPEGLFTHLARRRRGWAG